MVKMIAYLLMWVIGIGLAEAIMRTDKWRNKNL